MRAQANMHVATQSAGSSGPVPPSFAADESVFAVRVEADEPLPAGTGDLPNISGEVNSSEGISKLTSAADLLGPVTGPKVVDPTGKGGHYADDPQATCGYPNGPFTASQSYPVNGTGKPTIQSEAKCSPGPSATGVAYTAGGTSLLANFGVGSGRASIGPDPNVGAASASAVADAANFEVPGLLTVKAVHAAGWSRASGRPGGAASRASVTVSGLTIAGQTVSLSPAGLVVGTSPAVPVSQSQSAVESFDNNVAASGCSLTLLANPPTYPQGPLFARPPLPDRVNPDGTDAGSTAAGFLVRCVVPDQLNPTNFKPLLLQVVLGFVGTEAHAATDSAPNPTGSAAASTPPPPTGPAAPVTPPSRGTSVAAVAAGTVAAAGATPRGVNAAPALAGRSPRAGTPQFVRGPGRLVPIRSGLEILGMLLSLVLAAAGAVLLGPWRVPVVTPAQAED